MKAIITLLALLIINGSQAAAPNAEDLVIHWINGASSEELQEIKGIGPVMASRIIAGQIGEFHNYEDITAIKGIGVKTLERIISHVTSKS